MQIFSRISVVFLIVSLLFMMTLQSIGTVGAREQVGFTGVTNSPFIKSLEITSTPVATVYLPIVISQENPTEGTVTPTTSQPTNTPEATSTSTSTVEATVTFTATATAQSSPTLTPTTVITTTPTVSPTTTPALNVRITHIDPISEYVVIENPTSSKIVMTGWTLRDAVSTTFTFPDGFTLQPGMTVKVWVITGTNDAQNLYWGRGSDVWNNGGDTGILADADGKEVHQYSYPVATPEPTVTTTPATPVPTAVITSTLAVTITDVQFTPTEQEHVKIQNNESTPIDMSSWTLTDANTYKYVFPDGFTLQPGAMVTVWVISGTDNAENLYSGLKSPVWNNDSDTATLKDKSGVIIAIYTYPTGSAIPVPTVAPTPAYEVGSSPATATVRLTYIEYNPDGDDQAGEYVTIKNFGANIDITGWLLCDVNNFCYKFLTFTLQSQATVNVWVKEGIDTLQDVYWGNNRSVWTNAGDTAFLKNKDGDLIHRCTYQGGEVGVDCEAILTGGR